jgi:uncharacterized membrane protein YuzA (DUF378 family)
MEGIKILDIVCSLLLIITGLILGFWGIFQIDLVKLLFGGHSATMSRIFYTLVGVAALYEAIGFRGMQRRWCPHVPQTT